MKTVLSATVLCLALSAAPALSCAFHGYAPQPTIVEKITNSAALVLARPDPHNPFRYKIVKTLKGAPELSEIDQLVDSASRRKLAISEADHVLFALPVGGGSWQRIAYVDQVFDPVLAHILRHVEAWNGIEGARGAYFADLIHHPNRQVRNLALREMDLLSYADLRTQRISPNADALLNTLDMVSESNLRMIKILLLGLSDASDLLPFLKRGVDLHARIDGALLGAYATALIEYGGADAVHWLTKEILQRPDLSVGNRNLILQALSLHGRSGAQDTKSAAVAALSKAVLVDTQAAFFVGQQFGLQMPAPREGDPAYAIAVLQAMTSETEPLERQTSN